MEEITFLAFYYLLYISHAKKKTFFYFYKNIKEITFGTQKSKHVLCTSTVYSLNEKMILVLFNPQTWGHDTF